MASNEYVNKVQFGDTTIMDITDTTADSGDVIEGEVFYNKSGARSVGTLGDATTSTHGLMSAADKIALEEWKSLRLSVDAQGYVCQTVEVNE